MQVSLGIPIVPFKTISTHQPINRSTYQPINASTFSTISPIFHFTKSHSLIFAFQGVMLPLYIPEYFVALHPF